MNKMELKYLKMLFSLMKIICKSYIKILCIMEIIQNGNMTMNSLGQTH